MLTIPPSSESETAVFSEKFDKAVAWTNDDIEESSWRFKIDEETQAELLEFAGQLSRNPVPTELLSARRRELPLCNALMQRVRAAVFKGVRFAVVDALPLDRLDKISELSGRQLFWLLSSMVASPVAQKLDGTMMFDVKDFGKPATPGSGVRPAHTKGAQSFHNDNAFNFCVPDVVALLCKNEAKSGGLSRTVSFLTLHNKIRSERPDLLPIFYRPYAFDRQKEFWPEEQPLFTAPVFRYDGELSVRMSSHQIFSGYKMKDQSVPKEVTEAFDWLDRACEDRNLSMDFFMTRGMIQFVNNRQIGHSRTDFEEYDDPALKRHLLRLWLREQGQPSYTGL